MGRRSSAQLLFRAARPGGEAQALCGMPCTRRWCTTSALPAASPFTFCRMLSAQGGVRAGGGGALLPQSSSQQARPLHHHGGCAALRWWWCFVCVCVCGGGGWMAPSKACLHHRGCRLALAVVAAAVHTLPLSPGHRSCLWPQLPPCFSPLPPSPPPLPPPLPAGSSHEVTLSELKSSEKIIKAKKKAAKKVADAARRGTQQQQQGGGGGEDVLEV